VNLDWRYVILFRHETVGFQTKIVGSISRDGCSGDSKFQLLGFDDL